MSGMGWFGRRGWAMAGVAVAAISSPAFAQETRSFSIPSQPLSSALEAFGRQAQIEILFDRKAIAGKTSVALQGPFSPGVALDRLLAGSGLSARQVNAKTFVVSSDPKPLAETAPDTAAAQSTVAEVLVTGSRIRQSATTTAAPVQMLHQQDFRDRGYVTAGQALNDLTSITVAVPLSDSPGVASGSGQTFPNLFNLGPGRTLSLVDGRRFVSSATPITGAGSGAGAGVDTNLIPVGLIDRVDVVQAGGAAVYGSDAIAGVVNYVLKQNFQGLEMDVQSGISERRDYPQNSLRATAGTNFDNGRGNVAIDVEFSKTKSLSSFDRPTAALAPEVFGPVFYSNTRFYEFTTSGVIFAVPAPVPVCGGQNCFLRVAGVPQQFSPDGRSIVPFNPGLNPADGGTALVPPFAVGGEGYDLRELSGLYTGVERYSVNLLSHYDLTDHLKVSGSLLYGNTRGDDPEGSQGYSQTILSPASSGAGAITFTRNNPFLTAGEIAALSAASSGFATGGGLTLSKNFSDILPTRAFVTSTDSYRGLLALNGDFNALGRNFYYELSYSRGVVKSQQKGYGVYTTRFKNAIDAVTNASGQIVCRINQTTVVDPGCAPLNIFGVNTSSAASRAYVDVPVGYQYTNTQDDVLATIGGDLVTLPAGKVKFSAAYEHRAESADFNPSEANQLGLVSSGVPTPPTSGRFTTNEVSGEVLVPVLGEGFNAPGFKTVEVSGQYRHVDNSLAGAENVYGLGLRWEVLSGLSLRASRSRNFRAPTLYQVFAPTTTALGSATGDPCDNRNINAGPNPSVRAANCLALFTANPLFGTGSAGGAPVGATPAARLASFQDTSVNFSTALITRGGNPNLENELSDTTTFGVIYQPAWVPGQLTLVADAIKVDLANGITGFQPADFSQSCFDAVGAKGPTCGFFTRDAVGNIATATSTTYNAASIQYRGETYNIDYRFTLDWITRREDSGTLDISLEATHNERLERSVQGAVSQLAGTIAEPRWVAKADVRWQRGPLRLTYQAFYLPSSLAAQGATAANTAFPVIGSNLQQSVSAQYDFGRYQLRGGITDIADRMSSFPTVNYGSILGRQYYLGLRARF